MDSLQDITFLNYKGIKHPDIIERIKSYLRGMQNLVDENWNQEEKLYYKIRTSIQRAYKFIDDKSYKNLNVSLFEIHNIHQERLNDSLDDFSDHNNIYQRQLKKVVIPDDYEKIINDIKKYLNDPDFTQYANLDVFRIELLDKKIDLSKKLEEVQTLETVGSKLITKTEMISPLDLQIRREKNTVKHLALIPKFEAYLKLGDIKSVERVWFGICQNIQNAKHDRRESGIAKQVYLASQERSRVKDENIEPIQKAANEAKEYLRELKPNSKITKTAVAQKMQKTYQNHDPAQNSWIEAIQNLKEDSLKRKFTI